MIKLKFLSIIALTGSLFLMLSSCGSPNIQGGIVDNGNKPEPKKKTAEGHETPDSQDFIPDTIKIFGTTFLAVLKPGVTVVSKSDVLEEFVYSDQKSPLKITFSLSDANPCVVSNSFSNYYGAVIYDCGSNRFSINIQGKPNLTFKHNAALETDERIESILETIR